MVNPRSRFTFYGGESLPDSQVLIISDQLGIVLLRFPQAGPSGLLVSSTISWINCYHSSAACMSDLENVQLVATETTKAGSVLLRDPAWAPLKCVIPITYRHTHMLVASFCWTCTEHQVCSWMGRWSFVVETSSIRALTVTTVLQPKRVARDRHRVSLITDSNSQLLNSCIWIFHRKRARVSLIRHHFPTWKFNAHLQTYNRSSFWNETSEFWKQHSVF
jgi:hypothetical protein